MNRPPPKNRGGDRKGAAVPHTPPASVTAYPTARSQYEDEPSPIQSYAVPAYAIRQCVQCYGYGMWAYRPPCLPETPLTREDIIGGYHTWPCPECGANFHPQTDEGRPPLDSRHIRIEPETPHLDVIRRDYRGDDHTIYTRLSSTYTAPVISVEVEGREEYRPVQFFYKLHRDRHGDRAYTVHGPNGNHSGFWSHEEAVVICVALNQWWDERGSTLAQQEYDRQLERERR